MMPATRRLASLFAGLSLLGASAAAADWNHLLATEPSPDAPAVKVFGFMQPEFAANTGGVATGLADTPLAAADGQRPLFNGASPTTFGVRRARLAARGALPGTDNRVNYFLMAELGVLGLTRDAPVVLTDAAVTLSYIPGARVRIGQFKLPIMEEIYRSVPIAHGFTNFSTTMVKLLLENPIRDNEYAGGADGFRDVGAMVFDGVQGERWAGAYALMVSNGSGINRLDNDAAKDVTARGEVAYITSGTRNDPWRREVKLGGWGSAGRRTVDASRVDRLRYGVFLNVEQDVAWGLVEVAAGRGALDLGPQPAFTGSPVVLAADGRGWGVVAQAGARKSVGERGRVGVQARVDRYEQQPDQPAERRVFTNITGGIEVAPAPNLRFLLDYEHRMLTAPDASALAQQVATLMGDRVTGQVTARF